MKILNTQATPEQLNDIVETRLHREITKGVQTIQYQIITLMTTNGQAPFLTVFMYLNEAKNAQEKKDLALIIRRNLKTALSGRQERSRRMDYSRVPQADLCARRRQRGRGFRILLPDTARSKMHRKASGS